MLPSPHAAGDMAAAGGLYFYFEDGSGGGLGGWPDLADLRSALEPLLPKRRRRESAAESRGRGGGGGDSSCAEGSDCDAVAVPRADTTVTKVCYFKT